MPNNFLKLTGPLPFIPPTINSRATTTRPVIIKSSQAPGKLMAHEAE